MRDARDDLRAAFVVVGTLTVAGGAAGVLWWALAPRADFTVVDGGVAPVGDVSNELLVSDDGVYVLVLAGLGLLAGLAVWALRRHRGVPLLLALAAGMLAASGVAWQVGEVLGRGPAASRLADVGATVTSSLTLGALAALGVGPLVAVLVYVIATVFVSDDEIGRPEAHPPVGAAAPPTSWGSGLD
jgi:hypothetical protein